MVHWTRAGHARHRLGLGTLIVALLLAAGLIATAGDPATAPNDGLIVFSSASNGQIYSVSPRGTGLKQLTTPASLGSSAATADSPALSPDGRRVVFIVNRESTQQLWMMNADGSKAHVLPVDSAPSALIHPTWSPDGKKIAFSGQDLPRNEQWLIYVVNADGSNMQTITQQFATYPAWSPDGNWIAFDSMDNPAVHDPTNDPGGIFVVHPDGTNLHRLTPEDTGPEQYPLWSRDGKRLLYGRLPPDWQSATTYAQPLYEVLTTGSGVRQLTRGAFDDFPGAFSPDGKQVVFQREHDPRSLNFHLYVMNSDGSHVRALVPQMLGRSPSWGSQHTAR